MPNRRLLSPPARAATRLTLAVVAAVLLAAVACGRGRTAQVPDEATAELARLQRTSEQLERRLELAGGKDFYLVLDAGARDLTLMLRGATLQRYGVLGLEVGFPRMAWFDRSAAPRWRGVIWSGGELDPPRLLDRIVITPAEATEEGKEPEPPPIPPTAEDLYRVPSRYHVRFAGGLSLEIRPLEADAGAGRLARLGAWWVAKWGDVLAALGAAGHDAIRLRVVLSPDDGRSLYRSLPPAVRLLVIPADPALAGGRPAAGTPPR